MLQPNKRTRREPMHSPEVLEEAMAVIDAKAWIALTMILLLLGATLIWAFYGTMTLREDVQGVLVKSGKIINFYAPQDGVLLDMSIARDQLVERDQVIARMDQTELVNEINMMEQEHYAEADIMLARKELLQRSQIRSYESGRVVDVFAHAGDYVREGDKIATMLQNPETGKNIECLLFVPISQIRKVKKGMNVNVYPDFADRDEYGNLYGTISFISDYPVTKSYLYDVLGNEELADSFLKDSACYEVTVSLVTSEDTATGYKWTISSGPSKEIGNLSLCEASIVLDSLRPIDVFFLNDL